MSSIDNLTPIAELAELIAKAPKHAAVAALGNQIATAEQTIELARKAIDLGLYPEVEKLTKLLHYNRQILELLSKRLEQD